MKTKVRMTVGTARDMAGIDSASVDLMVTSPPYPMIQMWDEVFAGQDGRIKECLEEERGREAFTLMHSILDGAWDECDRVLKDGGLACINIGDATRTLGKDFQLYSNHSRILRAFLDRGYAVLPDILWRKPTNAPTKFLGSGMLPAGAYVTYEHEYILVLRKGPRRRFVSPAERRLRRESAFFWEERNVWFSDVWQDTKGAGQASADSAVRGRTGAFPFEIPYRLICMFSIKGDTVLDPFAGTGTTLVAALTAGRNAIGLEMDPLLAEIGREAVLEARKPANARSRARISKHLEFVAARPAGAGPMKYTNRRYGFPVMTSQETDLFIDEVSSISLEGGVVVVTYLPQDGLRTGETPLSKPPGRA